MLNILGRNSDHDFDQPIGLLSDCHRRIEMFLDLLLRMAREHAARALDAPAAEAVAKAKRYFLEAAPKHTADEEESLFPRMRAASPTPNDALAALDRLHDDHAAADRLHQRVDALLADWLRDGRLPDAPSAELVGALETLHSLYQGHIAVEEQLVFPLAGRILSHDELTCVGSEMRARRGLKPLA